MMNFKLAAAIVVIIFIVLAGLSLLKKPVDTVTNMPLPNGSKIEPGVSFSVDPIVQTQELNEEIKVGIMIDTMENQIDGVDVFNLRFDPEILEVVDSESAEGVQIKNDSLLPSTVYNQVDNKKGTIAFSQVTQGGQKFSGKGRIATVIFKAKKLGDSELSFDFNQGFTQDTNISANGADILRNVYNGLITIE